MEYKTKEHLEKENQMARSALETLVTEGNNVSKAVKKQRIERKRRIQKMMKDGIIAS